MKKVVGISSRDSKIKRGIYMKRKYRIALLAFLSLLAVTFSSFAEQQNLYYPIVDVTTNTLRLPRIISLVPGEEYKYSSATLECNQDYSLCSVKDIKVIDCNQPQFSPSPCY
jgi:hypothetical protein